MRSFLLACSALSIVACGPDDPVAPDAATTDAPVGADAPGLDAPGLDAPGIDAPTPTGDAPITDTGASDAGSTADAGDFEGHIVRIANFHTTPVTIELCLFPDGITGAPVRLMETLGRPDGLEQLEVSARYAFTPSRALVPVRVVDASTGTCDSPIFETSITGVRAQVLFLLDEVSLLGIDDTPPAVTAGDRWRHFHVHGASGVFGLHPDGGGPIERPLTTWGETSSSGVLRFTVDDGTVVVDERPFTPLPGGAFTSFTLAPTSAEVFIVVCDERSAGVDGLTPCGDSIRD